jgi:lipopolysaccharide export system protein LptA
MYRPFIKKLVASLFLLASFTLITPFAHAAKPDIEHEIVIKSKRQAGDLKNKIASYLDDVSITQGTLTITADLVQVFSLAGEDADTYIATGKPAVFKQLLDDGSLITLQADEIKYEPSKNTITISGNALLRQAGSEVSGSKIIYNTLTEQLEAESNNTDEPVTTILKPKKQGDKE